MKAHSYFIRRIHSQSPGRAVVAEGTQFRGHLPGIQSDILSGFSICSRPTPDMAKHPFVQPPGKTIVRMSGWARRKAQASASAIVSRHRMFVLLQLKDAGLRNLEPPGQLFAGHTQGLAHRPYPAFGRKLQTLNFTEPCQGCIEVPPGNLIMIDNRRLFSHNQGRNHRLKLPHWPCRHRDRLSR